MKYLISCCLLFVITNTFAQEIKFGFTASPTFNFTNIESEDNSFYNDSSSKLGFVYGVLLDYDFDGNDRYFLHSGLTLHHSGYSLSGENIEDTKVNVNYLEIPLALKLKTNEIGYFRYYGQFGVNNGIKVGQTIKEPENATETEANDFNTFNLGLNVGGGVEYSITSETSAVAGIYYNNGLTKAIDTNTGSIKQNQLGIRIGVYF